MHQIQDHLQNKNGILYIGGCNTLELAKKYDTPLYVYDENAIRERARRLLKSFSKNYQKFKLYYAIKANNNLAILKILREEGLGADCSCPAEIELALRAGFPRDKILYSGVYHRDDELEYGSKSGVAVNLEDVSQIDRLVKFGKPEIICFRINPGIGKGKFKGLVFAGKDAKFGIIERDVLEAYKKAKNYGFKKFGIHMMTGSCVTDSKYFEEITVKLLDIAGNIRKKLGIKFEFVDIGGGLGVSYKPGEKDLDVEATAKKVSEIFKKKVKEHDLGEPYLMIEPGRYLVCEPGILLTRVTSIKDAYKKFIGVDSGMNTLLRPALYNAYHEIAVANNLNAKKSENVNIVGPICENTDQFAKDRLMPKIERGDLLAVLNAGAYGFAMGSQYNTRTMCAEIIVNNGKSWIIRKRENVGDIVRNMAV